MHIDTQVSKRAKIINTKFYERERNLGTHSHRPRFRISQSPGSRLVVAVFGTAVTAVTVDVRLASTLFARGLGGGVGRPSPPAFGLPEHRGSALRERLVSNI